MKQKIGTIGCSFCRNAVCDDELTSNNDFSYRTIGHADKDKRILLRTGAGRPTEILIECLASSAWYLCAFYRPKFCPECGRQLIENCNNE